MINKACYFYDYTDTDRCIIQNSEIRSCGVKCKFFEVVSASPVFLNRMDVLYRNASKVEKEDGFEDIVMHSTSLYFVNRNADGKEYSISPKEFAQIIKTMYKGDIPNLRLIACSSGALKNGVAQKLADILNVKIKAPVGPVVIDFHGNMYVENPVTQETIKDEYAWKVFEARKE